MDSRDHPFLTHPVYKRVILNCTLAVQRVNLRCKRKKKMLHTRKPSFHETEENNRNNNTKNPRLCNIFSSFFSLRFPLGNINAQLWITLYISHPQSSISESNSIADTLLQIYIAQSHNYKLYRNIETVQLWIDNFKTANTSLQIFQYLEVKLMKQRKKKRKK